ncbi:hypothetical protein A2Z67_00165 [Candidatus Woesebacteria bacterium RBG_13_36_22]|uniref:Uncharacterized protein n=1 Tax=Candidatus Woesebacteria bacterium RBG_13_36_22 TaxID=1802478 RepID=A0A1F7X327_9BACT|nr:MAG: hypothetical protein A2Z67_00165 [Candidatus Woesebacteria bacterium RBG_13_36_22]
MLLKALKGRCKIFDCKNCGNEVIRSYGEEGKVKLRTNIIIWSGGECICKCLRCKGEVKIPLTLHLPGGRTIGYDDRAEKRKTKK